jgi:Family of unknown function (DUF5330)
MRLFRPMFLAAAAFMLMPAPPESALQQAGMAISAPEFFSAAAGTLSDMKGFCARQPGVCDTAGYVAAHVEARAKYGVLLIYQWANEAQDSPATGAATLHEAEADPIETGSVKRSGNGNTLTIEDFIPEWRGPKRSAKG